MTLAAGTTGRNTKPLSLQGRAPFPKIGQLFRYQFNARVPWVVACGGDRLMPQYRKPEISRSSRLVCKYFWGMAGGGLYNFSRGESGGKRTSKEKTYLVFLTH
jgi:hypothetical protein